MNNQHEGAEKRQPWVDHVQESAGNVPYVGEEQFEIEMGSNAASMIVIEVFIVYIHSCS